MICLEDQVAASTFGNGGSNLANGVPVTVNWIKPELVYKFVATLETMFQQTRLREGFRNRRLLRSDARLTEVVPLGWATCLPTLSVRHEGNALGMAEGRFLSYARTLQL